MCYLYLFFRYNFNKQLKTLGNGGYVLLADRTNGRAYATVLRLSVRLFVVCL